MSTAHKTDERIMTDIVTRGVIPTNPNDQVQLIIFYKNKKTSNLFMKNNTTQTHDDLKRTSVIYEYSCNLGDCKLRNFSYIGMTVCTLSRRLSYHLQNGTIKQHTLTAHKTQLTRDMLVQNTKIIDTDQDPRRLPFKES